jgi:hypothetical protein
MAKRRARRSRISFKPSPKVRKALKQAEATVGTVRVVGRIRAGVLEIDQAAVADVARKARTAKVAFVALNAPFKTRAIIGSL